MLLTESNTLNTDATCVTLFATSKAEVVIKCIGRLLYPSDSIVHETNAQEPGRCITLVSEWRYVLVPYFSVRFQKIYDPVDDHLGKPSIEL
jgi:hypothetical protein